MAFAQMTAGQQELDKLQIYLNDKPDWLTAIVKHRTPTKGQLGHLHIHAFDKQGKSVTILYHPPPDHQERSVVLKFEPELADPFEARGRMMEWRDKALEHFDVPSHPRITYFSPPSLFPCTVPLILALSVLFFALFGRGHLADSFRTKIAEFGGRGLLPCATAFAGLIHLVIYPIYMFWKLPQHRVPFFIGVQWTLVVAALGIAGLNELWNCIEYEKIRHIYARTDVGRLPPRVGVAKSKGKTA